MREAKKGMKYTNAHKGMLFDILFVEDELTTTYLFAHVKDFLFSHSHKNEVKYITTAYCRKV